MGDWNRRIARAFYERAGEKEKKQANELFQNLDSNRDGKISLREFKKGVESRLSNEKVFNELDWNRDGALDFEDVLVLFYYKKNTITILRCRGCRELIFGPSFSCFECLLNSVDRRYALCCDCYGGAQFHHQHHLSSSSIEASDDFMHDQALLVKLSLIMSKHPKSLAKKDMKRLWETAKSEKGGAASPQVEAMANNFLKSVHDDGANRLDIQQFSKLMMKEQESEFEAFLKPKPDSDFATNYMKNELRNVIAQSSTATTAAAATTSTPRTHYASPTPTHHVNPESTSSNAIVPILKVATTTFKIVDMALTIASLSSMCTIM